MNLQQIGKISRKKT